MRILATIALCLAGTCFSSGLRAENWPQFRGPNSVGLATEAQLPSTWGADKNIAWKIRVPGYGWSSPIVWGDKVFVTTAVSDKQQPPASFSSAGAGISGKGVVRSRNRPAALASRRRGKQDR